MNRLRLLPVLCLLALLAASCASVDKFVAPTDKILLSNRFEISMADSTSLPKEIKEATSNIKRYKRQESNKHLLGADQWFRNGLSLRLKMRIYCLSSASDSSWFNRYLRRQGEAPVVYDENAAARTCQQISGLLDSKGCFRSQVSFDTIHKRNHDVKVIYHVVPHPRYLITRVSAHAETRSVDSLLRKWGNESFIRVGDYYDQENLDAERNRIIELLRNQGYYYASKDLISFTIDTAFDNNELAIQLHISNPRIVNANKQVEVRPLQRYNIDNIFIYPNSSAASGGLTPQYDTLIVPYAFRDRTSHYYFLYNQPMTIKPQVLTRSLFLFEGQRFRSTSIDRTYNSLLNLRNFKYINIEMTESPHSTDSLRLLDAKIRLLTARKQRISASIEINNSSPSGVTYQSLMGGNLGLETTLSYQNKNLFGGCELFKAEGSLLVELPKLVLQNNGINSESTLQNTLSSFESSIDLSLDLPTFLMPFTKNILWQRMRPHTIVSLGGAYQYRSYFERLMANVGFGYNWTKNLNGHQLLPIEVTYVRFFNIDADFRQRMESISDARLKYQYSDHFIVDARYDYVYNTQRYNTRSNFNYFHLTLESAGNVLNGISSLVNGPVDENGIRQLFGVPYSQYVRLSGEFKHYFYFGQHSTFVTRALVGLGLPYLNSYVMPYEKSFFGGGPTTLRGWQLRHLGPGNFQIGSDNLLERVGDMQLVMNLEYRFPLFSIFEGALFTDLGNVWLVHDSEEFPGGKFSLKELPNSIAACVGLGLRANISIITIRVDLAIPTYDPGEAPDARWRIPHWKLNQFTANFGIDYPF